MSPKPLLIAIALLALQSASATPQHREAIREARDLQAWLVQNEELFIKCQVTRKNDRFVLCDETQVPASELKGYFSLTPQKLLETLRAKGAKVEVLCDPSVEAAPFEPFCQASSGHEVPKKLGPLHGLYKPDKDVILIRSSASTGSLIHEYIHRLQSQNSNRVAGKKYKQERNKVQKNLVQAMDEKIATVQKLEKSKNKDAINAMLPEFLEISDLMQSFAPWQDLIDERSIFLLYLKHGKELGIAQVDLDLARKNLGFICNSEKWKGKLSASECSLSE
jgi:hypothetical protein